MNWPNDADGDVLRRLQDDGFDFSASHEVDYMVDFDPWPPAPAALAKLEALYGKVELHAPDQDDDGYAEVKLQGKLSYETVVGTQRAISDAMQPYGGYCNSWGVMHEPD